MNPDILFSGIFASYALFISLLCKGWRDVVYQTQENSEYPIFSEGISVIIPFRNEEKNLPAFLNSLKKNVLNINSFKKIEFIFIDDHSEDQSLAIVKKWKSENNQIPITVLEAEGVGKKSALKTGSFRAAFEWILFSDADTIWPDNRLSELFSVKFPKNLVLLSGPVYFNRSTHFLFRIEFFALMKSGAAFIGLKKPIFCNGANLIVKKEVWQNFVPKLDKIPNPSGDDVFLLQHVEKEFGADKIYFTFKPSQFIETTGPSSFKSFLHQRIRWASKSKYYQSYLSKFVSIYILTFNLSLLFYLFFTAYHFRYLTVMITIFSISLLDFIFLNYKNIFKPYFRWSFGEVVLGRIFVTAAYPVIGFLSLPGIFIWKTRKFVT